MTFHITSKQLLAAPMFHAAPGYVTEGDTLSESLEVAIDAASGQHA